MEPGNVLIWHDSKFGHHRYFEVIGVFLGGENSESLVELRSLGEKPGYADEITRPTTFVPECLTRQLEVVPSMNALFGGAKNG